MFPVKRLKGAVLLTVGGSVCLVGLASAAALLAQGHPALGAILLATGLAGGAYVHARRPRRPETTSAR